ncbi:hypothetical protein [Streptomyces sp. NPDC058694]|uniref:hypothetical protein n=1 Tax=Streptomyces sp. NPDC058694 TaxID=3346603 RepID=UPI00364C8047
MRRNSWRRPASSGTVKKIGIGELGAVGGSSPSAGSSCWTTIPMPRRLNERYASVIPSTYQPNRFRCGWSTEAYR